MPGEVAAPAAPAPAATPEPQSQALGNAGAASAPVSNVQTRGPDGRFASANGSPAPAEAPKETAAQKRIRLALEAGKEEEFDESTVVGLMKRGRNAAQLLTEADKRMKAAEERDRKWSEEYDRDPLGALQRKYGDRFQSEVEKYLHGVYSRQELSPEQRKFLELQDENSKLKAEREAAAKAEEERALETSKEEYRQHVSKVLMESLQAGKLPASEQMVKRAASIAQRYWKLGVQPDPAAISADVKDEVKSDMGFVLKEMAPEHILDWLEDLGVMKQVRAADIARWKAKRSTNGAPPPRQQALDPLPEKKHLTPDEFRKLMK